MKILGQENFKDQSLKMPRPVSFRGSITENLLLQGIFRYQSLKIHCRRIFRNQSVKTLGPREFQVSKNPLPWDFRGQSLKTPGPGNFRDQSQYIPWPRDSRGSIPENPLSLTTFRDQSLKILWSRILKAQPLKVPNPGDVRGSVPENPLRKRFSGIHLWKPSAPGSFQASILENSLGQRILSDRSPKIYRARDFWVVNFENPWASGIFKN